MSLKKVQENETEAKVYIISKKFLSITIFCTVLIGTMTFVSNFSLKTVMDKYLLSPLTTNRVCPINFKDIKFNFFMPGITLVSPEFSARCFGSFGEPTKISEISINLSRPSFSPFGVKLKTSINLTKKDKLIIYPTIGITSSAIKIDNQALNISSISQFLPKDISSLFKGKPKGKAIINFFAQIRENKITKGSLKVDSKNLFIPTINKLGFEVPKSTYKNFSLRSRITTNNLNIENFSFGDSSTSLIGLIKGNIKLNQKLMRRSSFNLNAEVRVSGEFKKVLSADILEMANMMAGRKKDAGPNFKLTIRGPLNSPSVKVVN